MVDFDTFSSDLITLKSTIAWKQALIKDYEKKVKDSYKQEEHMGELKRNREHLTSLKEALTKMEKAQSRMLSDLKKYPYAAPGGRECLRCRTRHPVDMKILFIETYNAITYDKLGRPYHGGKQLTVWECIRCGAQMYYATPLNLPWE